MNCVNRETFPIDEQSRDLEDISGNEISTKPITICQAKDQARLTSTLLHNLEVDGESINELYESVYRRDHNFCHGRRTEGDLKDILEHGPCLRNMQELKQYYFPAFLAIREHDVIQVITGKKRRHAQRGAFFTLCALCHYRDQMVKIDNGIDDPQKVISDEQIYSTITMIRYHSHPQELEGMDSFLSVKEIAEEIPSISTEERQEILKKQQDAILKAYRESEGEWSAKEARAVAAKVKSDFEKLGENYFIRDEEAELYDIVPGWRKYHEMAMKGELLEGVEERVDFENLRLMAKLVAAADKLDGIAGGAFSFIRLFKTPISDERPFYTRTEGYEFDKENLDKMLLSREDILRIFQGKGDSIERELWQQALIGRGESPSDECRIYAEFLKAYEYLGNLSKRQDIMIVKSKLSYYLRERFKAWKGFINALEQGEGIADIEEAETEKDLKKGVIGYFRKVIEKEEKKSGKDKHKPKEKECLKEDFVFVVVMLISKLKEEGDIFSLPEEERKKIAQKMKRKANIIGKYLDEFYPQSVYGAGNPSKKSYYPPY